MSKSRFQVSPKEKALREEVIDPRRSVFLTANAGSGKTTILTNRVIRLLLDGAEPSRILCLTYTKAAAAEMQNRIFDELSAWVRLDDVGLGEKIASLRGERPRPMEIALARSLFARAVETPGGLKIQTIHAFAERLLHLFPFEANVPVRFTVLDDLTKGELLEKAKRQVLRQATLQPQSVLGRAFAYLAEQAGEDTFDKLLMSAVGTLRQVRSGAGDTENWHALLSAELGLSPHDTEETLAANLLACFGPEQWQRVQEAVRPFTDKPTNSEFLVRLQACFDAWDLRGQNDAVLAVFLTQKNTPRAFKSLVTQDVVKASPWTKTLFDDMLQRIPALWDFRNALRARERSMHLMQLAHRIVELYQSEKQQRALVDFDDMIDRALSLVSSHGGQGASWVLMKLDGGIDHVLIDEAQDTPPRAWKIARYLTGEFFAGEGARDRQRTVFAVGDEKQSIYSFQGARPEAFAEERSHYRQRAREVEADFVEHELQLSFRTVEAILAAVDAVFSIPARFKGLRADNVATVHTSARLGDAGHVEIWPLEEPSPKEEREAWEPVDALGQHSAQVRLAEKLAAHVAHLMQSETFANDGAPIRAGDIMVLLQRRDAFFQAVIRALKQRGVPVAGADRVKLSDQIGVMDLIAAARVALMPEDDLSLAEVLKSPLVGLGDDDLIGLAPKRAGSLYAALAASTLPSHSAAFARIERWRRLAQRETPFGFFSTLLGSEGGRRALLSRLGPDAADGLDLFLAGIANRETLEPPSLVRVVEAFDDQQTEVKREQEQAGSLVRVLTVHGAKGLEARIVYLPSCTQLPRDEKNDSVMAVENIAEPRLSALIWPPAKPELPSTLAARRAAEAEARMEEYRRLFYVAMTRARDRLYIGGWGDEGKLSAESWYAMAKAALAAKAREVPMPDGSPALRWEKEGALPVEPAPGAPDSVTNASKLPPWLHQPVADEPRILPPLRPSRALDAADQRVSPERDVARQRGDLVHLLLERLTPVPEGTRQDYARTLLATHAPGLSAADAEKLAKPVLDLMESPAHARLFGPEARSEVAISGEIVLPGGHTRNVLGRLDRLVIGAETIVLADFKTGSRRTRQRSIAQLALYRALLARIYPGKPVEAQLVWTANASAETISPAELDAALSNL